MKRAKKFMRRSAATLLAAAIIVIIATGCSNTKYRSNDGGIWHTTYHITYRADKDYGDSIISTLNEVGSSVNCFSPVSTVSRINANESLKTDRHFVEVYGMAVRVHGITGAFDPTLGPLIDAWGFGKGHKATADTLRLDSLLELTGIEKTHIEKGMLVKNDPRIQFNFSAIAKGYGCDAVAEMLTRNGVEDYLVEIGGEIRCGGISPSGKGWRVSIDRPVTDAAPGEASQCVVTLTDCGLATSGNYRNYHQGEDGKNYGHTISPATGRPAATDVLSATVIAPTAMEADALATAMMALGSMDAERLATEKGFAVLLVKSDMSVWKSPAFPEE